MAKKGKAVHEMRSFRKIGNVEEKSHWSVNFNVFLDAMQNASHTSS